MLVVLLLGLPLGLAFRSGFWPAYSSVAVIVVPAAIDPERLDAEFEDPLLNERFIATQLSLLTSRRTVARAVRVVLPGAKDRRTLIAELRSGLETTRLPFDNTITVRLSHRDGEHVPRLLAALIEEYRQLFQEVALAEARPVERSLAEQVAVQTEWVRAAETAHSQGTAAAEPDTVAARLEMELSRQAAILEHMSSKLIAARTLIARIEENPITIVAKPSPPTQDMTPPVAAVRGVLFALGIAVIVVYVAAWRTGRFRIES